MAKYIAQHRRGTTKQWYEAQDIIPLEGEIVIEIDDKNFLHKLKIGDGIHAYSELAYLQAGDVDVTQILAKALPRVVTVTLDAEQWTEITCETDPNLGYYSQTLAVDNITTQSRLDLQPDADMLAEFQSLNLVFVTENKNGVISVCSVGDKPTKSYTMQATIVETELEIEVDKVVGIPVGAPSTYTETDPTVPAWAKASTKPTYTADEVGADPAGSAEAVRKDVEIYMGYIQDGDMPIGMAECAKTDVQGNSIVDTYETKTDASLKLDEANAYTDKCVEELNDGFTNVILEMYGSDIAEDGAPTIRQIANNEANTALDSAKKYTDSSVSSLASTSAVDTKISTHNTSTSAHNDIRALITDLTTKLNNFLDVDDTTSDQLSEVLTLIENNKGTLESLTTSKVNVSDIVNNLTTNSDSKVLSASQGVAIKTLIDALQTTLDGKTSIDDASTTSQTTTWSTHKIQGAIDSLQEDVDGHTQTIDEIKCAMVGGKSVMTYGAVGDGTTDDTSAFVNALAENRYVYVPGGTYKLSGSLVIRENCCLELSQDAVLDFKQTSGNAITMLRSASLNGNHATIFVPYTFSGNVLNADTGDDEAALVYDKTLTGDALTTARANANKAAVKPFTHWNPQWKMSRYVTDINICKAASAGYCHSSDGKTYGNAIYLHCDEADMVSYMWGVNMSGIRISGAFDHGIYAYNKGAHVSSWNHDMRIEAVIDACKIGALLDNCYYARLALSIQGRKAENGTIYAQHGIKLVNSRGIDLSSSRVWDWNEKNSLWTNGGQYQHIALIGECRGLILDAFEYYETSSIDIRDLIYTDTPSNLTQMTILQEPIDRWFKVKDDGAYYSDGSSERKLLSQSDINAYFDTDIVTKFTDVLPTAIDTDGSIFNGVGYKIGYIAASGAYTNSNYYYATGFIPCKQGTNIYAAGMSFTYNDSNCRIVLYDANFNYIMHVNRNNLISNATNYVKYAETDNGFVCTIGSIAALQNVAYARLSIHVSDWGKHPMISINNEIKYTVEGFLADGVNIKGDSIVMTSSGGKSFKLVVNDDGTLTTTEIT